MKFSVSLRGASPPLPKARPAKRYRGIAEKPHRLASRARTARPTTARPNSMNTWETSGGVVGILEPRAEYQFEKVLGYTDVWLAKNAEDDRLTRRELP